MSFAVFPTLSIVPKGLGDSILIFPCPHPGLSQVRMYVEEQDEVPWDTLNVIVADVTYGGRVTDVWDKRTIASIMRLYFDPGLLDDSYRFRWVTHPLAAALLLPTGFRRADPRFWDVKLQHFQQAFV